MKNLIDGPDAGRHARRSERQVEPCVHTFNIYEYDPDQRESKDLADGRDRCQQANVALGGATCTGSEVNDLNHFYDNRIKYNSLLRPKYW